MTAKPIDSRRLDVALLAAEGQSLTGQWPLAELSRLVDLQVDGQLDAVQVDWAARGELRPVTGGAPEVWLHLRAGCRMALCCQRCLGPVSTELLVDRAFHFVPDESLAERLDADSEDDVLVLARWMDLQELVEDELLLALPLVPRHDQCPQPLPQPVDDLPEEPEENPFAMLAALKKGDA
jgi:uncharacterized protein